MRQLPVSGNAPGRAANVSLTTSQAAVHYGTSTTVLAHLRATGEGPEYLALGHRTIRYLIGLPVASPHAGHNGRMVALYPLPPEMPEAARRALVVVSPISRMIVARYLYQNPGITRAQIIDALGMPHDTVRKALRDLIAAGFIESLSPNEERRGHKNLGYTLDRTAFDTAMKAWTDWFEKP